MDIFVCVKQVPHENCEIVPIDNGASVDQEGFVWIINPEDECAVEQALLIKEVIPETTITAITVEQPDQKQHALITALAMGVDQAILVEANDDLDPYQISKALAGGIHHIGKPDLVLSGNTGYDGQSQLVPQLLAHKLALPSLTHVNEFQINDETFLLRRQSEAGVTETYKINQPALITCSYGLNEPRYAPLPFIKRAEKTPLIRLTLEDVGVTQDDQRLRYSNIRLPEKKTNTQVFDTFDASSRDNVLDQLVTTLRQDIKQLASDMGSQQKGLGE